MITVSTSGMAVSLKTDLRFPMPGQQGHESRNTHNTSSTKLLHKDTVYLNDIKDLFELELQYENLDLSFCQRALINDYIACMQTVHASESDYSYIAGIIDAIQILHSLSMLKIK